MADKNGNLLAMKMKDQVYIEVCDWELETIRKELQKYAKYKRAFEILKEKLNFELVYDEEYCGDDIWYLDSKSGTEISKEEYELLEELMNK